MNLKNIQTSKERILRKSLLTIAILMGAAYFIICAATGLVTFEQLQLWTKAGDHETYWPLYPQFIFFAMTCLGLLFRNKYLMLALPFYHLFLLVGMMFWGDGPISALDVYVRKMLAWDMINISWVILFWTLEPVASIAHADHSNSEKGNVITKKTG